MTATGEAVAAAPVARTDRGVRRYLPTRATWPLWAFTAGMPAAYAIGIHGLAWCAPGVVLGSRLILQRRSVRYPRSTIPLLAFLCWALLSLTVVPTATGYLLFTYRWLLFASALAALVWLVNVPEEVASSDQIVDWLAALWIVLVVFGYLGILLPNLQMTSPFQRALGGVGRNGFVSELTSWRLAETQGFLGYPLPRPAAPFGGTNGWGAAMGILTPFFVRSWIIDVTRTRRRWGCAIAVAAAYPIVLSVNRGLWVSLGVGLVYYAARRALRGTFGPVLVLGGALLAVAVLMVATPMGGFVQSRLHDDGTQRSNDYRAELYHEAYQGAKASPLIGNGAPQRAPGAPKELPPIGTHGLLWYLMFVHGFVGLFLFLSWMAVEVIRSGRVRNPKTWWTHLSLVMAVVEVPFYGLLPQVVIFGVAAGLAHREDAR